MDAIGFIGLGKMGGPMATLLARAGHAVRGYDADPGAARELAGEGVEPVGTVAEAAAADCVILMLPTSAVVRQVLHEEGGLAALPEGAIAIDMGSSEPLETQRLAAEAAERGAVLIDAPVSGGTARARNGTLTVMAGGPEDAFGAVEPVLGVLGEKVRHVGPVGAGHTLKALNNLLSATSMLASSEALTIARRFGLDPEVALEVINASSGRSGSTELKLPEYVLPGTYDSGFSLALMVKDVGIAVGLGESLGAAPRLGAATAGLWNEAASELAADADHTEIARWVEAGEEGSGAIE